MALAILFTAAPGGAGAAAAASADTAVVSTTGACLNLRAAPAVDAPILVCLPNHTPVELLPGAAEADGHAWAEVSSGGTHGWVAASFLRAAGGDAAPTAPNSLPAPPPGGMTVGLAGTTSLAALIAAQSFDVRSITAFDVDSQAFLSHIPGAPPHASSLTDASLRPDHVVLIRRTEIDAVTITAAGLQLPVAGVSAALPVPPPGGFTAGAAGTSDIATLIAGQPFPVVAAAAWQVSSQQWLAHIPGAPAVANSLDGALTPDTIVFLRRSTDADLTPPPSPPPATPAGTLERITYYFCERGTNPASWGDGGGFCGYMRNGEIVHPGAASCGREQFGRRFRIEGDPTGRTYTCTDTGGGVYGGHRDVWFFNSDDGYAWRGAVGEYATVIPID